MDMIFGSVTTVFVMLGIIYLVFSIYIVHEQEAAVIEQFGKFHRIASPGLHFKIPIIHQIKERVNLRIQQLDVKVETKTSDDVFLHTTVSVQYYVIPSRVYFAFYRLQNPKSQITSFVFDVVRAKVPKIELNHVFEKKDEIAKTVEGELTGMMSQFGYGIVKTLVTDIEPARIVKESMNEITAAQRLRVAATEKGEAERILKVKSAQAEAESKALQGQGIANQRTAIINGLRDSIDEFSKNIPGATPADVMNLVLITQYFDTLKDIGANNKSSVILIPHSPANITDIKDQLRDAMITAHQIDRKVA